ncbi:Dynein light chain, cytoplasmic [Linum perenne]
MASQEKRRKGFLRFYKFGSKSSNTLSKPQPPPPPTTEAVSIKTVLNSPLSVRANVPYQETVVRTVRETVIPASSRRGLEAAGGRGGGGMQVMEKGRKSVSHVETNLDSVASFLQVKVFVTDMPGFMQVHAFRCARRTFDSLDKFSSKHMAYNMKKQEFDKVYGPSWHCIVGSSFGSFVTHSTGCFLYFSIEKLYILVFKTKVQKSAD